MKNKKFSSFIASAALALTFGYTGYAQTGVAINSGTGAADASAQLDVSSTTQGVLVPRMSTANMTSISSPANGLIVFNTTTNGLYYNAGSSGSPNWVPLLTSSTGSPGAWSLTGNAGTVNGTNFIGTTDNIPFSIRVNNQKAGKIDHILENTFFGYQAGNANTTGFDNVAIGLSALYSNLGGGWNTALGIQALYTNTSGNYNTAVGLNSLQLANADNNTACGMNALQSTTSGGANTAIGLSALVGNTTGDYNTGSGFGSAGSTTSGIKNTAIGANTLSTNTTGSNNTALGYGANVGSNNLSNATVIGYNATVTTSNSLVLGSGANVGIGTTAPGVLLDLGTAGTTLGVVRVAGSTSGNVTIQPQAVAGTYNFNLPTGAGSSGQPLLSGGGSSTAMTFGTLGIGGGGTNSSSALSGSSIMISNGTSIVQGSAGTSTQLLHGNASGAPTYSQASLTADVTGTLPVGNGGTGATTFTSNGVLYGNGSGAVAVTAASGAAGQILQTTSSGGAPTFSSTLAIAGALTSSSPTAGIGYSTGAGGTITQTGNKSTAVTIHNVCGTITMMNTSIAAGSSATFTVNNNAVAATDVIYVQHDAVGTFGAYTITPNSPAAGSFNITIRNNTSGALGQAIVLRFVVIKAVTN